MPSVEPTAKASEQQAEQASTRQNNDAPNGQPQQQQDQPSTTANGGPSEVSDDPDRHLIPADRIEHVEDATAPIDLPTVREFTQNDKINKFLLNSFLQRLNDTDLSQFRDGDAANGEDQEQDFEA